MAREPISVLPKGFDEAFASLSTEDNEPSAAQSGPDTSEAGEGEDTAPVGEGENTAPAGEGEGTAEAGEGEDTAPAGEGEETAEAGEGEDTAEAGEGDDAAADGEEPEAGQQDQQGQEGDEDPISRLARLLAQSDEGQGKQKQEPQQQQQQQQQEPEPEPEIYTAEEKQILEEYEKEWPEVARAEELRRRSEYQELVKHVFDEVAQQMVPMADMVRTLSERTHMQDLQEAVGDDYSDLRDEVVEWVQQQPSYLQGAYQHVIDQGTVDEVTDLINRFKAETGRQEQQQAPAPAPQPKKETELPAQTKKAAASLAPVSSKRTAVPKGEDPTDFDSAFESFAGKT